MAHVDRLSAGLILGGGGRANASLDLRGHHQEGLLHVRSVFGRCLDEWNALGGKQEIIRFKVEIKCTLKHTQVISKLLGGSILHHLLLGLIGLVANQQLVDIVTGVAIDFVQPLLHIVERLRISHVVDHDDAMGTAIVRRGDGAKVLEKTKSIVVFHSIWFVC